MKIEQLKKLFQADEEGQRGSSKLRFLLSSLRVAFALAIAFALLQFPFYTLEFFAYDMRMLLSPTSNTSGKIQIVSVDKNTIDRFGHEPGAAELKLIFDNILRDKPTAILYTTWPFKAAGSFTEIHDLAKTLDENPSISFVADDIPLKGEESKFILADPFQKARVYIGPLTRDLKSYAADDVTRRAILATDGQPIAHVEIAKLFNNITDPKQYRGSFAFRDSTQVMVDFHPKGTFPPLSFKEISEGKFEPGAFTNKVVVIGRDAETDTGDYIRTPFSKRPVSHVTT